MKYLHRISPLIAFALITGLAGCGKDNSTTTTSTSSTSSSGGSMESGASTGEVAKEVTITANDQIKYNISEFSVPAGKQIKLTFKNVGSMPKYSMGHNVVILVQSTNPEEFVQAAMTEAANDYIPKGSDSKIIAHTKLLGGGEETSITFTAPKKKGDYTFICSFPGHFQQGMKGTMHVE